MGNYVVKPPVEIKQDDRLSIFLGGSIEMGKAEDWQSRLANDLSEYSDKIMLINPRRDDWDSSWVQDPTKGTKFHEQVDWELKGQLRHSDICVYYFSPETKSPITLMELGMMGTIDPYNVIVCCPKEFYRYGNVVMFCKEIGVEYCESYEDFLEAIKTMIITP